MSKVFVAQSEANKVFPTAGRTLQQIAQTSAGNTWQEIARYNWGTENAHEVNRVLVEQFGCTVPNVAPELSPMDPRNPALSRTPDRFPL